MFVPGRVCWCPVFWNLPFHKIFPDICRCVKYNVSRRKSWSFVYGYKDIPILFNSSGKGPVKSSYTSSFGSRTDFISNECCFLLLVLNFYLVWYIVGIPLLFAHEQCICGNQMFWHRSSSAANLEWFRWSFSSVVCLSWVGRTSRLSIRSQSSLTCNRMQILYQYWPFEHFSASQIFLPKFIRGRMFLSFLPAAAIICSPYIFCRFSSYSGVYSRSAFVSWFTNATIHSVYISYLVSIWVFSYCWVTVELDFIAGSFSFDCVSFCP